MDALVECAQVRPRPRVERAAGPRGPAWSSGDPSRDRPARVCFFRFRETRVVRLRARSSGASAARARTHRSRSSTGPAALSAPVRHTEYSQQRVAVHGDDADPSRGRRARAARALRESRKSTRPAALSHGARAGRAQPPRGSRAPPRPSETAGRRTVATSRSASSASAALRARSRPSATPASRAETAPASFAVAAAAPAPTARHDDAARLGVDDGRLSVCVGSDLPARRAPRRLLTEADAEARTRARCPSPRTPPGGAPRARRRRGCRTTALGTPRRNVLRSLSPAAAGGECTRTTVPRSDAVASRVPSPQNAIAAKGALCARISHTAWWFRQSCTTTTPRRDAFWFWFFLYVFFGGRGRRRAGDAAPGAGAFLDASPAPPRRPGSLPARANAPAELGPRGAVPLRTHLVRPPPRPELRPRQRATARRAWGGRRRWTRLPLHDDELAVRPRRAVSVDLDRARARVDTFVVDWLARTDHHESQAAARKSISAMRRAFEVLLSAAERPGRRLPPRVRCWSPRCWLAGWVRPRRAARGASGRPSPRAGDLHRALRRTQIRNSTRRRPRLAVLACSGTTSPEGTGRASARPRGRSWRPRSRPRPARVTLALAPAPRRTARPSRVRAVTSWRRRPTRTPRGRTSSPGRSRCRRHRGRVEEASRARARGSPRRRRPPPRSGGGGGVGSGVAGWAPHWAAARRSASTARSTGTTAATAGLPRGDGGGRRHPALARLERADGVAGGEGRGGGDGRGGVCRDPARRARSTAPPGGRRRTRRRGACAVRARLRRGRGRAFAAASARRRAAAPRPSASRRVSAASREGAGGGAPAARAAPRRRRGGPTRSAGARRRRRRPVGARATTAMRRHEHEALDLRRPMPRGAGRVAKALVRACAGTARGDAKAMDARAPRRAEPRVDLPQAAGRAAPFSRKRREGTSERKTGDRAVRAPRVARAQRRRRAGP